MSIQTKSERNYDTVSNGKNKQTLEYYGWTQTCPSSPIIISQMSSKRTYLVQYYRLGCVGIYRKEVLCLEYIHFCIWNVTVVVRQYVRDDIKSTKRIWGISPFSFGDLHKLHKNFFPLFYRVTSKSIMQLWQNKTS